ncbi:MAG: hypothetical protein J2P37_13070 [Ktedonobacteraceae bacterium]|nr:hypothetical protein [Ktedonobacteraceae bacterium]
MVRQKVDQTVFEQRAPLLTEIVRQGMQEGSFITTYPEKSGEVIMSLLQGMGNTHGKFFRLLEQGHDDVRWIQEVGTTHAAYMDAIERVLGAPLHAFARIDAAALHVWMMALKENNQKQRI